MNGSWWDVGPKRSHYLGKYLAICQSSITHLHFKAVSRLIILTKRFRYQLNHMSSAFGLIVGDISEAQLMER